MMEKGQNLGGLCEFINGGSWTQKEYDIDGIPVVQVTNITEGTVDIREVKYLNRNYYDKYKKHELRENDLVIATVGSHPTQPRSVVGRAAGIPKDAQGYLLNQNAVCIRSVSDKLDQRFLVYLGKSPLLHNYIISRARGAANQVRMAIGELKNFNFNLPGINKQRKIANILSSYDDLIENNLKRIKLLEETAELIYKEWFVNFRFPGYEKCEFVDGVPSKWYKETVGNMLLKIKRKKKVLKADYLEKGDTPVIDQSVDFIGGYTNDQESVENRIPAIVFGDHTRIVKFIDFEFASGADGTQLIYSKDEQLISQEYFYLAIKGTNLSNYAYARHFKYLKDNEIYIPDNNTMELFTNISSNLLKQIKILREQNEKLQEARDILLPKLIRGEIEV